MDKILLIFLAFFLALNLSSRAQNVHGCTDPLANNHNPSATINDGSCTYNPTIYNPPFRYLLPDEVNETSGLVYFREGLWTINDSGNDPILFHLDTLTGNVLQEITISDAMNVDWEALAQDDLNIYIGDFGNNSGNRDDLGIYIVSKNDIPENGNGTVTSDFISFEYVDYPGSVIRRKENNFDCEAMIAIEDSLYLFSKNYGDSQTKLYRLPKDAGTYTAELLTSFNTAGLVTGADYNSESREVTLIGYTNNSWVPFMWLLFDYHDNRLFSGNKRRIDLLNIAATQTEAIAYTIGKTGAITSEGNLLFSETAYGFYTGTWTDASTTGIGTRQAGQFDFVLSPNPVDRNKLTVNIESLPAGDYQIELFDSAGKLMQIKEYQVRTERGSVKVKLKVGHLKAGLYFVRMRSVNTIVEKKFIKQ